MRKFIPILFVLLVSTGLFAQTSKTVMHGGVSRQYLEYVPAVYNGSEPVPIVICLHGLGDNMNNFSGIGMHYIADTANFIVITPQALVAYIYTYNMGTAWNSGASYMGFVLNQNVDDVGLINKLIDTTMALYNIDTTRIYVTGFSMGGFMCYRLACDMGDRIAAIAPVSGTMGAALSCSPSDPMPVCHFHGTADSTVTYTGNQYGNDPEVAIEYWRNYNQCDASPIFEALPDLAADGRTVEHYTWPNGNLNTEVEFFKVIGGDHEWLFQPTNDITYTIEIWKFFMKHSKTFTSSVGLNEEAGGFSISPNPSDGFVNVQLAGNTGISNIRIYNYTGEVVKEISTDRQNISFDGGDLDAGIYIMTVTNGNYRESEKFVIY
ncbi:MAG: T9SS type A sorting domain-containing protein [Bacteroidota bacterium]